MCRMRIRCAPYRRLPAGGGKNLEERHIGSLRAAPVAYIGLQDRANATRSLTAGKPHSTLCAIARSVARAGAFGRAAFRRSDPREPRTGRAAGCPPDDGREAL